MSGKKILVFAGIGAIVLLVGGAGFLLFMGYSQYSRARRVRESSMGSLDSYYAKKPFPSDENLVVEEKNGEVVSEWVTRLLGELRAGQIEPQQVDPAAFMTKFNRAQNELKVIAEENGTICVPDFAFSFERYSKTGDLPEDEDVPRLTQQLAMVEGLSKVLFEAGITGLQTIERDAFEAGAAEKDGNRASTRRRRAARGSAEVSAASASSENNGIGLFGKNSLSAKFHFKLEFTCKESAIQPILNSLAAHEMFIVTTSISFAKRAIDVRAPDSDQVELAKKSTEKSEEPEVDKFGVVKAPPAPPARGDRIISGRELEVPMAVILEVDIYNFTESK